MIEFVRTVEDEIALAAANDEESGAHPGAFFVVVIFLAFVVVGVFSGQLVAVAVAGAPGLGVLIGLACGAALGTLVLAKTPGLRRRWVERRRDRYVRPRFEPAGRVRLWLDREGLNLSQDGMHLHLPAATFEGATQLKTDVLWEWGRPALEVRIPRRVGARVNEIGWVLADLKARGAEAAESHGLESLDRPSPGSRPVLTVPLTMDDLSALAGTSARSSPAERRRRLRIVAGPAVVFGLVLAIPAALLAYPDRGAWVLAPAAGVVVAFALLGWWFAAGAVRREDRVLAARVARAALADGGDHRQFWLDASGLGWADAAAARHVDWAALRTVETSEHFFLLAPHRTADTVIPRGLGAAADQLVADLRTRCGPVTPTD